MVWWKLVPTTRTFCPSSSHLVGLRVRRLHSFPITITPHLTPTDISFVGVQLLRKVFIHATHFASIGCRARQLLSKEESRYPLASHGYPQLFGSLQYVVDEHIEEGRRTGTTLVASAFQRDGGQ